MPNSSSWPRATSTSPLSLATAPSTSMNSSSMSSSSPPSSVRRSSHGFRSGVVLVELVRRALQLDQPPDPELVPVILGRRALEVIERRLVVAAVVEDVREVDARFGVLVVDLERLAERRDGRVVLAEPVLRVADAGDRLGALGRLLHRDLEELLRHGEQLAAVAQRRLAEQRAADLEHQVQVVGVPELERAAEAAQRRLLEPELEQRLAESGQRVLVLRLEDQRLLEAAARPGELLAREPRVPHADVQLHRRRIEREPLTQHGQRLVVLAFVVELVGALVVLFGAQERGGHGYRSLRLVRVAL